tara:strand:+ start:1966 stop:2133 length:168 start_codon:yes stop_codon:yes gene_type:complete
MRRTIKLEYLKCIAKTVAIINDKGEYEIKPTESCEIGEKVWMIKEDNTFIETSIF